MREEKLYKAKNILLKLDCPNCIRLIYTGQYYYDCTCSPVHTKRTIDWASIYALIAGILSGVVIGLYFIAQLQKPVIKTPTSIIITPIELPNKTITFTPTPTLKQTTHSGIASYYSREGCIGCSPSLTMANGQELDDNALTVAYNRAPLGTQVKVVNITNGQEVVAIVTDTGGFEKIGRIIDLTIATRDAIGCSSLCKVEVVKI